MTWDYTDDYRETVCVKVTPHGLFRAVVRLDEYADAPEDDLGDPVFRHTGSAYRSDEIEHTGYGRDVLNAASAWAHFADYALGDTTEVFERWLRIFHDGAILERAGGQSQSDYETYLAYTCRELRAERGVDAEHEARHPEIDFRTPNMTEWIAYVNGEVFGIAVERAVSFDSDGEPDAWADIDGPVYGFYGEEYAKEEALAELRAAVESSAEAMLPLDEVAP